MTAHTPGPWRIDPNTHVVVADHPTGWDDDLNMSSYGGHLIAESVRMPANARLIAVAPEMLALLQELIDIEGPQPGTSAWAEKVRAVITKATKE